MVIDAMGTRHQIATETARIISLVPSLTELLFDLGLGPQVVGRTHYCTRPKGEIERIESVGGTKKINLEKLRNLHPDYVLLNIDENPKEMADALGELNIPIIVTHPKAVADNRGLYHLLGSIFDRTREATELTNDFDQVHGTLAQNLSKCPLRRVLYLIWQDPWMSVSADTYIADMLRHINWQVIPQKTETRYPECSFSNRFLEDIDLVLFSSEPYDFTEKHLSEFSRAYPHHAEKAHLIDGEMMSWYGSRAIKALNYLNDYNKALST